MRHLSAHSVWPIRVLALLISAALACGGGVTLPTPRPPAPVATLPPATVTPAPTPTLPPASPTGIPAVFKTPEAAITAYLEGVAQNDVQKIAQACAIEQMSAKFNFELYTQRIGGFLPLTSLSPTSAPLYVETNKMQLTSQIFSHVKILAYSLLSTEKVDDGTFIVVTDTARIDSFMQAVDPHRLASLTVMKTALPDKAIMQTTRYLQNAAQLAQIYGADESTERVVLFSFEQNDYVLGFSILRYGDSWIISSQSSPLSNISGSGAAVRTTVADFDNTFGGN